MTHQLEPTPVVTVDAALAYAQEVSDEQYAAGRASRGPEVADLTNRLNKALADVQRVRDEATVTVAAITADRDRISSEYADHMATPHDTTPPPDPDPDPEPEPHRVIVGMSSPRGEWAQRVADVGPGLGARRIFADLDNGYRDQGDLIAAAIADGLIPVVSYKGNPTGSILAALGGYLAGFGTTIAATYWHEPYGDFTDYSVFLNRSWAFLAAVKSPNVKVGPFLNGWLLDRKVADFKALTTPELLTGWDFLGIDTYEAGTLTAPGATKPADRIPLLVKFARDNGIPDKPLAIGEYNGYSAATIKAAGDAILACPTMWLACMWNSTEGKGYTLTGDRLAAFRATLADPRVA